MVGVVVQAERRQMNGENLTRRLTGRQRRREAGEVKDFSMMKDAESDEGDMAPILK